MRRATTSLLIPKVKPYCGFCGNGHHRYCPSTNCSCSAVDHEPGDELAASMRLYQDFSLVGDTIQNLAAEYRESSSGERRAPAPMTHDFEDSEGVSPGITSEDFRGLRPTAMILDEVADATDEEWAMATRTVNPVTEIMESVPDTPKVPRLPLP